SKYSAYYYRRPKRRFVVKQWADLSRFMIKNNLVNSINKPTRVARNMTDNGAKVTKTLIDVCLHNSFDEHGILVSSDVVGCPFSDHNFISVSLNVECDIVDDDVIFGRNLCPKNVDRIISD
ncbi:unnamed protein product, partial [Brachionus calyciflorus]